MTKKPKTEKPNDYTQRCSQCLTIHNGSYFHDNQPRCKNCLPVDPCPPKVILPPPPPLTEEQKRARKAENGKRYRAKIRALKAKEKTQETSTDDSPPKLTKEQIYKRAYREKHKDRIREYNREYQRKRRAEQAEENKEYKKQYYQNNKAKIAKQGKALRAKKRQQQILDGKAKRRTLEPINGVPASQTPEYKAERSRKWKEANAERNREYNREYQRKRVADETPEQKEVRLARRREVSAKLRAKKKLIDK